jgi:PAS domain-containing protein
MSETSVDHKTDHPLTFSEYVSKFDELQTVFDSLPDGVIAILDAEMNIATANRAVSNILEIPLQNIIGKKSAEVFEKTIPGLIEVIRQTIKTRKGVRNYTIESVNEVGVLTSFLVSTTLIEEIGEDTGMVLILHRYLSSCRNCR